MYWPIDLQGVVSCYRAGETLLQDHPEYILHDDNGNMVRAGRPGSNQYFLDWTREDTRNWYTSVPLSVANMTTLLDGEMGSGPLERQ